MHLHTFINAYQLALAQLSEKVTDWKKCYINAIILPGEQNKPDYQLTFQFTNTNNITSETLGIAVGINIEILENDTYNCKWPLPVNKFELAKAYINNKEYINEAGRFIVLLNAVKDYNKKLLPNSYKNSLFKNIQFNWSKDIIEVFIDDYCIVTNGCLTTNKSLV